MTIWREWSRNPLDGAVTEIAFDRGSDGTRTIHARTRHSGEMISRAFDLNHFEASTFGDIREQVRGHTQKHKVKIASIPISLYYHLRQKFGDPGDPSNRKKWTQWLNDPDNRHFRVAQGNV